MAKTIVYLISALGILVALIGIGYAIPSMATEPGWVERVAQEGDTARLASFIKCDGDGADNDERIVHGGAGAVAN